MLSRATNVLLMLAVIVLSIALMRAHHRQQLAMPMSAAATTGVEGSTQLVSEIAAQAALFAAALAPLEALENEISTDATAGAQDRPLPPGALGGAQIDRERDRERSNGGNGRGATPQRDRRHAGMPVFTGEMGDRCIEVAREVDHELGERLSEARSQNPEEFERQMRVGGFGRRLLSLAQLKTSDPLLYGQKIAELSLAVQIDRVARQVREHRSNPDASLGETDALEAKLRTLLQVQLAMSIKARGDLLCRFEERAAELREDLDREARLFQTTVETRFTLLTADRQSTTRQQ